MSNNCYTNKFQATFEGKLKNFFAEDEVIFEPQQYAFWRAKGDGYAAIFYNSGKFLIQGAKASLIAEKLEQFLGIQSPITPALSANSSKQKNNDAPISIAHAKYIGTDESGKGDYFGPLVIAGVLITEENKQKFIDLGIKDSKKLNDTLIKKLALKIQKDAIWSVVTINPEKYNELYAKFKNLNKLLAWGHSRVIENILEKSPDCGFALSDKFGDESLIKNALMKNGRNITLEQRVRAEADIAVACASILARAEFVSRISSLSLRYGLEFPKGASEKVVSQAKDFVQKFSKTRLNEVAKLHFKTTQII